jgi:predicted nuclease of predicted toxin-antitoxin system
VRWLIDECVNAALAALLRESGHDVVYMSDLASRAPDPEVITRADREY